ncbi:metal-binding protein [Dictyobacter vulcani]|uniref:Metal-binding protein n=1 Tax=Dictyobacter vulcani TaxID=2607529 RepID=A0A5J4KHW0_9CHLR|nr:Ada metal-binding domain-containing protein [Dictyobacter vulcani]GER89024.1 metal-binding protein [Dictyobacter vulcani]
MKMYTLVGPDGKLYESARKGTFGGYKREKIYGRFDCPSANRAIAKGQYVQHRVFFADEITAIEAGYRPCGNCMKERYSLWKQAEGQASGDRKRAREIYRSLCGY